MTMSLIIRKVHVQHKIVFIQLWGTEVVQNILQRREENNSRKSMNMIKSSRKISIEQELELDEADLYTITWENMQFMSSHFPKILSV